MSSSSSYGSVPRRRIGESTSSARSAIVAAIILSTSPGRCSRVDPEKAIRRGVEVISEAGEGPVRLTCRGMAIPEGPDDAWLSGELSVMVNSKINGRWKHKVHCLHRFLRIVVRKFGSKK